MCPCSPNDVSFPSPTVPNGPAIPGFGIPFTIPVPSIPFPAGFPEDLLDILNKLQMLIPPGALKPALNPNFGKDIFDGIMKLLDQFMPFLMLYKFFLPILRLIICIIEVLCALMNPFALMSALNNLFSSCIPEFLNLFPIFALILMILSLLLLLLALIEYIIAQILKLIQALLRNINALIIAFQTANAVSVAAIAKKLASLLCIFQNIFVLMALFTIIIQIIKDILSLVFSIPPCQGGGPGSTDGCCAATYCPSIVQGNLQSSTGTFKYQPEIDFQFSSLPLLSGFFNTVIRPESWQIYDLFQTDPKAFTDIVNATDVSDSIQPKPVYFPTDATYNSSTPPRQAAYTVDLRMLYNPISWGRIGPQEYIRFTDCIVTGPPTFTASDGTPVPTGVLNLVGGKGFLDDGVTVLKGFNSDGSQSSAQATLENFIHTTPSTSGQPLPQDGYTFQFMTYTFKPNIAVLLQKNLVNAKCMPQVGLGAQFMADVVYSQVTVQAQNLADLVNGANGHVFPDTAGAEQCLLTAVSNLRTNMTVPGVAEFQAATNLCLNTLQVATEAAIADVIGIGFNPCESTFTVTPSTQFTTQPIVVAVNLNENNGLPLTQNLPPDIAQSLANNIKATATFGTIGNFSYDGYQTFVANITSDTPGNGEVMIAFQNQILCNNDLPTLGNPFDSTFPTPSHTLQTQGYTFVYAPFVGGNIPQVGEGDTSTGTQPRRDPGDTSRDSAGGGS
jgi:hypothetical protein